MFLVTYIDENRDTRTSGWRKLFILKKDAVNCVVNTWCDWYGEGCDDTSCDDDCPMKSGTRQTFYNIVNDECIFPVGCSTEGCDFFRIEEIEIESPKPEKSESDQSEK
jgi:hypothetical protein